MTNLNGGLQGQSAARKPCCMLSCKYTTDTKLHCFITSFGVAMRQLKWSVKIVSVLRLRQ